MLILVESCPKWITNSILIPCFEFISCAYVPASLWQVFIFLFLVHYIFPFGILCVSISIPLGSWKFIAQAWYSMVLTIIFPSWFKIFRPIRSQNRSNCGPFFVVSNEILRVCRVWQANSLEFPRDKYHPNEMCSVCVLVNFKSQTSFWFSVFAAPIDAIRFSLCVNITHAACVVVFLSLSLSRYQFICRIPAKSKYINIT